MIKIDKVEMSGLSAALRGMRNPLNSWDKSDSHTWEAGFQIGAADIELMKKLIRRGSDHRKFLRAINISFDVTAPLYWWTEFDTYKVGTTANSCSRMHTLHKEPITMDNFSFESLSSTRKKFAESNIIPMLESLRLAYNRTKSRETWRELIQLLPGSFNQKRTISMNAEVLRNMYFARRNHKLIEWREFCKFFEDNENNFFKEIIFYDSVAEEKAKREKKAQEKAQQALDKNEDIDLATLLEVIPKITSITVILEKIIEQYFRNQTSLNKGEAMKDITQFLSKLNTPVNIETLDIKLLEKIMNFLIGKDENK